MNEKLNIAIRALETISNYERNGFQRSSYVCQSVANEALAKLNVCGKCGSLIVDALGCGCGNHQPIKKCFKKPKTLREAIEAVRENDDFHFFIDNDELSVYSDSGKTIYQHDEYGWRAIGDLLDAIGVKNEFA